jgi:hypothetical protein
MRESPKPDGMSDPGAITTADVVALLSHYGVTAEDLENERRRGFLPSLGGLQGRGDRAGVVGIWSRDAVKRAKRLYRLRARGASGERLRLLLFLADGWGWEHVRDTCIIGLRKVNGAALSGVARYADRDGGLDATALENVQEHQHAALVRALPVDAADGTGPTSLETLRFSVGHLRDASQLDGGSARRISGPLAGFFWPGIGKAGEQIFAFIVDAISMFVDIRAAHLERLLTDADAEQADRGRRLAVANLRHLRHAARRAAGSRWRNESYNLLTISGRAGNISSDEFARNPARVTGPQALGWLIGTTIAIDAAFAEAAQRWRATLVMVLATSFSGKT